jgi:2-polyprenyl-3-methyl-5-hydroxy-6-metoxy-1,4-benzoquinol methylase
MSSCICCGKPLFLYFDQLKDDRYGHPDTFSILRCYECGYMGTSPRLIESDLSNLYSSYYPRKHVDFDGLENIAGYRDTWFSKLRDWYFGTNNQGQKFALKYQKVLDIGCGSCSSLLEMRRRGVLCWGIEADPNVKIIADHFGLNVHIGSIFDKPFNELKFDLIVLNQVVEHVPEPSNLLVELKDRLVRGGLVIISCPNTNSVNNKLFQKKWINWHVPFHQHHFNLKTLTVLIKAAGFEVKWSKTITPTAWTEIQLSTFFGNNSKFWNQDGVSTKLSAFSLLSNILKLSVKIVRRVARIFYMFMLFLFGRVIDIFGAGDSIIVAISLVDNPNHAM